MIINIHMNTAQVSLLQSLGEDSSFYVTFGVNQYIILAVVQNSFLGYIVCHQPQESQGTRDHQCVCDRASLGGCCLLPGPPP